ncbi:hypothetical protein Q0N12_17955 [Rossellomorea marisflavi]|uniref:hypothetical protein n=1 Tax=Rossellomorea marisflavi TaxID=189381 RepID=UPI00345798DB
MTPEQHFKRNTYRVILLAFGIISLVGGIVPLITAMTMISSHPLPDYLAFLIAGGVNLIAAFILFWVRARFHPKVEASEVQPSTTDQPAELTPLKKFLRIALLIYALFIVIASTISSGTLFVVSLIHGELTWKNVAGLAFVLVLSYGFAGIILWIRSRFLRKPA